MRVMVELQTVLRTTWIEFGADDLSTAKPLVLTVLILDDFAVIQKMALRSSDLKQRVCSYSTSSALVFWAGKSSQDRFP